MKKLTALLTTVLVGLSAQQANAIPYNFDIGYNGGGNAFLEAGSDNPVGTNLQPGDTFVWNFHAASPTAFWQVTNGDSLFPFMAWPIDESGSRVSDSLLTLLLDGVSVFSTAQNNSTQSFAHLGTNAVTLSTGLQYDEAVLSYSFLSSDSADATINSLLSFTGAPELGFPNNIDFVQDPITVPEPTSLALVGIALAAARLGSRGHRKINL